MIVTDEAKSKLKETLQANTDDPEFCLRLAMKSASEFGLVLDKEAEGDEIIEHEESKVLLIGKEMTEAVDNLTLDVQDTPEGKQLVLSTE